MLPSAEASRGALADRREEHVQRERNREQVRLPASNLKELVDSQRAQRGLPLPFSQRQRRC